MHRIEDVFRVTVFGSVDHHEHLSIGAHASNRADEPAADCELFDQRFGDVGSTRGHDDGVERSFVRPAEGSVSAADDDVVVSEVTEQLLCSRREGGMPLDAVHRAHHSGEHCGAITRAGAPISRTRSFSRSDAAASIHATMNGCEIV